jgi:hypothetical protein
MTIRGADFSWEQEAVSNPKPAIVEITALIEWFRERLNFEILVISDSLPLNMEHVLRIQMF